MGINRTSFSGGLIWIVFLLGLTLLVKLGFWQLSRMEEKKAIEHEWAAAQASAPVPLWTLLSDKARPSAHQPVRMPASLSFLPQIFLLDNQVRDHRAGYRVFRLVKTTHPIQSAAPMVFLIEGPWVSYEAAHQSDHNQDFYTKMHSPLPSIGYIRFPSPGLQLSAQAYKMPVKWPLVLQWIDFVAIGDLIGEKIAVFWIQFDKPQLPSLSPQKHLGYALQWFLFAGLWTGYGGYLFYRRKKGVPI
jgi:cytochrome oxidase assembly protein ShyY1